MQPIVRAATEDDLPPILAIYNDIIRHTTAVYDYTPHTLEMRTQWFRHLKGLSLPVFVAIDAETVVGFCSLSPFRKWGAYKYSVENSIYVAADCRGQGIGRRLLAPLVDAAIEGQFRTIIAGIDTQNEASFRLHRAFGFEEVAHFREVGFKFGRWLDLKFFQRMLPGPPLPIDG
jgi:phosphinothricin acetyltransferase